MTNTDTNPATDSPVETMQDAVEADRLQTEVVEPATVLAEPAPNFEPPYIAPSPQPMKPQAAAPAPPQKSGSTLLGIVIGAVLAVGAGYGAQQYYMQQTAFDPTTLEARVTAAEAEAQALRAELSRVNDTLGAAPTVDPALADRIAALEAAEAPDVAALAARLDGVEANLASLADLPSETGVSPAALAALQAEVASLKSQGTGASNDLASLADRVEARLAEAETRAADLTAQADAIATAAMRNAALGQIGAALDSGLPYRAALTGLGDEAVPEIIAASADTGLPSIAILRAGFPEAARLALEAALRANPGESWTDRVGAFLRTQTGARSLTAREGTDPDAILSRAEAALARADLQAALTEVAALPPEAQAAMADWLALAQQRLDAQAAVASLLQGAGQ